jgi:hypothetical protein
MSDTGKNVEKISASDVDIHTASQQKLANMVDTIYTKYLPIDDPRLAIANMAERILDAENFEDMFTAAEVEPNADLFDVGLHVENVSWNRSEYDAGLPFYAVFSGHKITDGAEFITTCGAWQPVVIAYRLLEQGWLPRNLIFHRQESATRAGYHPVNILPWNEPF